ncbi:MAG: hypothetical protein O7G87_22425 [bacterium]|nr:hypothetical protein [bacterium]
MRRSIGMVLTVLLGCSSPQDPVSFSQASYVDAPSGATAFYDRDLQQVFDRSCIGGCHEPGGTGNAQTGLLLTEAVSFEELLDQTASTNGPHVLPGDPDNSLLVWKLEGKDPSGRAVFGDPMPFGRAMLDKKEIGLIRTWIREGAIRSLAPPVPPSVLAATSLDNVSVEVTFSEALDPVSAANPENYQIEGVSVLRARLEAPDRVVLTTSVQTPGVDLIVVASGVRDVTGDAVVAGSGDRASFRFIPIVSFASQIVPVFTNSCAFVGCHGASDRFPPGEGMVLDAPVARQNIVDRASQQNPQLKRVMPLRPDESYLIQKLAGTEGIVGDRMPQGGPFFSPAELQIFRLWIEQGAQDN